MTTLYRAGRQLSKLRWIVPLCLVFSGYLAWMGVGIMRSYGLRAADGGMLAPLGTRLLFGGAVLALGVLVAAAIVTYAQCCYVRQIDQPGLDGSMRVTLAGVFGSPVLEISSADVTEASYHHGEYHTYRQSVKAPWFTIWLTHRRLPLVLDAQGEFLDREQLSRLLD